MAIMSPHTRRWLIVCALPLLLSAWFALRPAADATGYLINGIILSCACVFLLKYVLFSVISAHLRGDAAAKRQACRQLLPLAVFAGYIVFYFLR